MLKRPFEIHDGKCNNAKDNTIKRGCHFTLICNLKADDDYYYSTEESVSDA